MTKKPTQLPDKSKMKMMTRGKKIGPSCIGNTPTETTFQKLTKKTQNKKIAYRIKIV